jgi:hypothetical protein
MVRSFKEYSAGMADSRDLTTKSNGCAECESIQKQMRDVEALFQEHERIGEALTRITDFGLRLDAVEKREHRRHELVEMREEAMLRQLEHVKDKHRGQLS